MGWFEIDKGGLKQLMDGRDKSFILRELAQNAFDEPGVTFCKLMLDAVDGRALVTVTAEDDAPEGFYDVSHAYTMFGNTRKRADASKRGRFNFGEKQVLSLAKSASIKTTTGTVLFEETGERRKTREKTERGSIFSAVIPMTRAELDECHKTVRMFLPPKEVKLFVNTIEVLYREPLRTVEATLVTEFENGEGQWRRTRRKTAIEIHLPKQGERPMIYEMGLPVVELDGGDKYHYNIMQRVPLNADRDNVSPAFLRDVRAEVMNAVADLLTKDEAAEAWTRDATESDRLSEEAFNEVIKKRHGDKVVAFSPADPEANAAAMANGYTVLSGGSMSKKEWSRAKSFGSVPSSASTFPTRTPEFSADGEDSTVPMDKWTPGMHAVTEFIEDLGRELLGGIVVRIVRDRYNRFSGWYGSRTLTINLQVVGNRFFDEFPDNMERVIDFAIHEMGHEGAPNHLSEDYYRSLTSLGARCTLLALSSPKLFKRRK